MPTLSWNPHDLFKTKDWSSSVVEDDVKIKVNTSSSSISNGSGISLNRALLCCLSPVLKNILLDQCHCSPATIIIPDLPDQSLHHLQEFLRDPGESNLKNVSDLLSLLACGETIQRSSATTAETENEESIEEAETQAENVSEDDNINNRGDDDDDVVEENNFVESKSNNISLVGVRQDQDGEIENIVELETKMKNLLLKNVLSSEVKARRDSSDVDMFMTDDDDESFQSLSSRQSEENEESYDVGCKEKDSCDEIEIKMAHSPRHNDNGSTGIPEDDQLKQPSSSISPPDQSPLSRSDSSRVEETEQCLQKTDESDEEFPEDIITGDHDLKKEDIGDNSASGIDNDESDDEEQECSEDIVSVDKVCNNDDIRDSNGSDEFEDEEEVEEEDYDGEEEEYDGEDESITDEDSEEESFSDPSWHADDDNNSESSASDVEDSHEKLKKVENKAVKNMSRVKNCSNLSMLEKSSLSFYMSDSGPIDINTRCC